jgi:hypothetical protein
LVLKNNGADLANLTLTLHLPGSRTPPLNGSGASLLTCTPGLPLQPGSRACLLDREPGHPSLIRFTGLPPPARVPGRSRGPGPRPAPRSPASAPSPAPRPGAPPEAGGPAPVGPPWAPPLRRPRGSSPGARAGPPGHAAGAPDGARPFRFGAGWRGPHARTGGPERRPAAIRARFGAGGFAVE